MRKIIFILIIIFPQLLKAQKIFVAPTNDHFEQPLIDKLIAAGRQVVFKEDSADLIVRPMITLQKFSSAKGYILVTDRRTGATLAKSKEYGSVGSSFNTSPGTSVVQKIANKSLLNTLEEVAKDKPASAQP